MMKRNTIQRSLVFEAVNKLQSHATADEIYEKVVTEHPNVSRATVSEAAVGNGIYSQDRNSGRCRPF